MIVMRPVRPQRAPTFCGDNLDTENGETCDDGNTAGGDGCASNCRLPDVAMVMLIPMKNVTMVMPSTPIAVPTCTIPRV